MNNSYQPQYIGYDQDESGLVTQYFVDNRLSKTKVDIKKTDGDGIMFWFIIMLISILPLALLYKQTFTYFGVFGEIGHIFSLFSTLIIYCITYKFITKLLKIIITLSFYVLESIIHYRKQIFALACFVTSVMFLVAKSIICRSIKASSIPIEGVRLLTIR